MGATPTPIEIFSIQRPTTEMVILQKKTLNFSCYMGRRRPLIFIICYGILGVVLLFQWGLARHGPTQDTLNASHSLTSLNITMDATKRKSHSQSTSQGLPLSLFEGDNKSLVVERVNEYFRESFQNLRREHQSQLLQLSDRRERRLEKFLEKARKEHSDWVQEALSGKSTWLGFTQTLTEYNKKLEKLEKDMRKEGLDSDTLFPRDVSNVIQEMPRTRISGFKFCSILNNAVFNPWVHIYPLKGSLFTANPSGTRFTKLIDLAARQIHDEIIESANVDPKWANRFACYMSVQAQSEYSALSDGLLMTAVDATQYFPKLTVVGSDATRQYGPGLDMPYSVSQTSAKKHYKIAYLILAHENPDALVRLMQSLYSSDGLYMIHIDAKVPKLQSDIDQWLKQNEKVLEKNKNVFLMKDPFELQWGSSSIVMAQLEGFFQLLDLATWDYVVNLSVYDYPLLSTGALHKKLEAEAPGKSYISYWKDDKEMFYRLSSVVFSRADKKHMVADQAVRQFPFLNLYPIYKHHQWMILSQDFVRHLRRSQETYDLLAFMENSYIPDESFFAMFALSPDLGWSDKIVNDAKRYIYFPPGAYHPATLHDGDEGIFASGEDYYFARKLDPSKDTHLAQWIDDRRDTIDADLGITEADESEEPL